jgi:hypothetical protein
MHCSCLTETTLLDFVKGLTAPEDAPRIEALVTVHDVGTAERGVFVVMELVRDG